MDPDAARRYDSWFDQRWGRYAWRIEFSLQAARERARLQPTSQRVKMKGRMATLLGTKAS